MFMTDNRFVKSHYYTLCAKKTLHTACSKFSSKSKAWYFKSCLSKPTVLLYINNITSVTNEYSCIQMWPLFLKTIPPPEFDKSGIFTMG